MIFAEGDTNMKKLETIIAIGMGLSLLLAQPIYASTEATLSKSNAYAIGILICLTFGLSIYLFWVIFQPERF
jgi:K+-transporting ATPase KdpF subunit